MNRGRRQRHRAELGCLRIGDRVDPYLPGHIIARASDNRDGRVAGSFCRGDRQRAGIECVQHIGNSWHYRRDRADRRSNPLPDRRFVGHAGDLTDLVAVCCI